MTAQEIAKVVAEFDGSDAAPGHLTWREWEEETGLRPEEIRQLCPAFSVAELARTEPKDSEHLWDMLDRAWVSAIMAARR